MDLIERQDAIDALCDNCDNPQAVCAHYPCKRYTAIEALPSAQPTVETITEDTIRIVVDMDTSKINRILLAEKNTHWGEIFYADGRKDAQPEIIRCKDCSRWCICHRSDEWYCADAESIKRG